MNIIIIVVNIKKHTHRCNSVQRSVWVVWLYLIHKNGEPRGLRSSDLAWAHMCFHLTSSCLPPHAADPQISHMKRRYMETYFKVSEQCGRLDVSGRDDFSSPEGDFSYWNLSPNIRSPPSLRGLLLKQRVNAAGSHLDVTVKL